MRGRQGLDGDPELEDLDHGSMTVEGATMTLAGIQIIDVSAVTFLGSAAIAYLVRLVRSCAPARLQLLFPGRSVRRPLEMTGVISMFDVVDTAGTASDGPYGP